MQNHNACFFFLFCGTHNIFCLSSYLWGRLWSWEWRPGPGTGWRGRPTVVTPRQPAADAGTSGMISVLPSWTHRPESKRKQMSRSLITPPGWELPQSVAEKQNVMCINEREMKQHWTSCCLTGAQRGPLQTKWHYRNTSGEQTFFPPREINKAIFKVAVVKQVKEVLRSCI